jgi:gamma-glutamyltranspeptidase/glutathione hydrolase
MPSFFKKLCFCLLTALLTANIATAQTAIFGDQDIFHPVFATHGMVATQEAMASQIGLDILKQGGNAIDAGVAIGFALAVTLPRAGNLGGGGFMMVHSVDKNETVAIDFREMAPAKAFRDMYLDEQGNAVAQRSRYT